MTTIKLPTADLQLKTIESNSTKTLLDALFTVEQAGYHAFGSTVGRGLGQVSLDVSHYETLEVSCDRGGELGENPLASQFSVLLFTKPDAQTGNTYDDGDSILQIIKYETIDGKLELSGDSSVDVSSAQGAIFIFNYVEVGAKPMVRVIGRQASLDSSKTRLALDKVNSDIKEIAGSELLSYGEFTSQLDGYHAFGKTIGRGSQTCFDVRSMNTLEVRASRDGTPPSAKYEQIYVVLYHKHDSLMNSALFSHDDLILSTLGPFQLTNGYVELTKDNGGLIDVSNAQGAVVIFEKLEQGATARVCATGSKIDSSLLKIKSIFEDLKPTLSSQLLIKDSVTSQEFGYHAFGSTVGRGRQTCFDIRNFESLEIDLYCDGVIPSGASYLAYVLLYENYNAETKSSYLNDDELVEVIGPIDVSSPVKLKNSLNKAVDVSHAQGVAVVFHDLDAGVTANVRVVGGHLKGSQLYRPEFTKAIDIIKELEITHSDIFTELEEPKNKILYLGDVSEYAKLQLYIISSYKTPIEIRVLETSGGTYAMSRFNGFEFLTSEVSDRVIIPSVPSNSVLKFSIHHAIRYLNEGMVNLQVRMKPLEYTEDEPSQLKLMLLGVRK